MAKTFTLAQVIVGLFTEILRSYLRTSAVSPISFTLTTSSPRQVSSPSFSSNSDVASSRISESNYFSISLRVIFRHMIHFWIYTRASTPQLLWQWFDETATGRELRPTLHTRIVTLHGITCDTFAPYRYGIRRTCNVYLFHHTVIEMCYYYICFILNCNFFFHFLFMSLPCYSSHAYQTRFLVLE